MRREFPPARSLGSWPASPSRSGFISAWGRQCRLVCLPAVFCVLWRALILPEPTSHLADVPAVDLSQGDQSELEGCPLSTQPRGAITFLMFDGILRFVSVNSGVGRSLSLIPSSMQWVELQTEQIFFILVQRNQCKFEVSVLSVCFTMFSLSLSVFLCLPSVLCCLFQSISKLWLKPFHYLISLIYTSSSGPRWFSSHSSRARAPPGADRTLYSYAGRHRGLSCIEW